MLPIYIKFLTEAHRARGFYELARRCGISSLPGQIYQVSPEALGVLEELHIDYRRATAAEAKDARDLVKKSA